MRLRQPTAGERKEGGEMGGKRRGCQGGTVCGSLGSSYCLKLCLCVCMSVFTQHIPAQPALYYLRSGGICARQSFIWETWVGKFGNWAPLKNFHSPLNAAIPKLCIQPTATVGKKGLELTFSAVFSFLRAFLCTLPAEHDQAFDLLCILPLDSCKAQAAFKAQQEVSSKMFPPTSTAVILQIGVLLKIAAKHQRVSLSHSLQTRSEVDDSIWTKPVIGWTEACYYGAFGGFHPLSNDRHIYMLHIVYI